MAADDAAFHARISVNYVRHSLTDYEERLDAAAGKVGVAEARELIYELVFGAIAEAYPWLWDECHRQERERVDRDYFRRWHG